MNNETLWKVLADAAVLAKITHDEIEALKERCKCSKT